MAGSLRFAFLSWKPADVSRVGLEFDVAKGRPDSVLKDVLCLRTAVAVILDVGTILVATPRGTSPVSPARSPLVLLSWTPFRPEPDGQSPP